MKVLYLSAWYPSSEDAMSGLFVQKHMHAVARQGADVRVIYSSARGLRWWREILHQWLELKRTWGLPDVVQMNVLDKNGNMSVEEFRKAILGDVSKAKGYMKQAREFMSTSHLRMCEYEADHLGLD